MRAGKRKVRFTTLDAGDPLATTIKFAGESAQTGGDGEVVMSAEPGRYTARATHGAYTTATRRVKVE